MQFLGKFGKIVCWRPPGSWRPLLREILDLPLWGQPKLGTHAIKLKTKFHFKFRFAGLNCGFLLSFVLRLTSCNSSLRKCWTMVDFSHPLYSSSSMQFFLKNPMKSRIFWTAAITYQIFGFEKHVLSSNNILKQFLLKKTNYIKKIYFIQHLLNKVIKVR